MSLTLLSAYSLIQRRYKFPFLLKTEQKACVDAVLKRENVLGVLPTGYGKSLCFVLPPLVLDQIHPGDSHHALIISPLRSLMFSQKSMLSDMGISCVCIMPEMTQEDRNGIKQRQFTCILSSPESIMHGEWASLLKAYGKRLTVIAVDEVHCVVQWGETIRAAYKQLPRLQSFCPQTPWLLLTATATEELKVQMLAALQLGHKMVRTIAVLPDRPEIFLSVNTMPLTGLSVAEGLDTYMDLLRTKGKETPKAILYCKTLNQVGYAFQEIVESLGEDKAYYTASGEDARKRCKRRIVGAFHGNCGKVTEQFFISEFTKPDSHVRLMICTVAFGMGIDIPDVRFIFHWGPSTTLLNYWQEIGRAARDSQQSEATLFTSIRLKPKPDESMQQFLKVASSGGACIRVSILQGLALKGMDLSSLDQMKVRPNCEKNCSNCLCCKCKCCSVCRGKCPCTLNN